MAKPIDIARRNSFNDFVETYDRNRPSYPRELYQTVFGYADVKPGTQALEIGIGTGHATEPFLQRGAAVTAVEIGDKLAAFSRERFKAYPGLEVVVSAFEDIEAPEDSFDLIYAASSFHWIPEEIGFPKAYSLLKPGGTLALFWNRHFVNKPDDELHCKIQRVYDKYMPDKKKHVEYDRDRYGNKLTMMESYGFREGSFHLFHSSSLFNSESYIGLLKTYSDHVAIPEPQRTDMQNEIAAAIKESGDRLIVYDTLELYLGRK